MLHHRLERIVPRTRRRAVKHAVGMVLVHVMADCGEDVDGPVVALEEARDLAVSVKIVRHLPADDIGTRVQDRFGRINGQALSKGNRVAPNGVDDHRQRHGSRDLFDDIAKYLWVLVGIPDSHDVTGSDRGKDEQAVGTTVKHSLAAKTRCDFGKECTHSSCASFAVSI